MNEYLMNDCSIDIRQVSDSRKSVFTNVSYLHMSNNLKH